MQHLYFVTPDFSITLAPCEQALVADGYKPYIPRPIREHLGLIKVTEAYIAAVAASHTLEAIESQLHILDREDAEFDRFWTATDDERPSPITRIIDDAMDRIDVISLEFEPWDLPKHESLNVHSPLAIVQKELPF